MKKILTVIMALMVSTARANAAATELPIVEMLTDYDYNCPGSSCQVMRVKPLLYDGMWLTPHELQNKLI